MDNLSIFMWQRVSTTLRRVGICFKDTDRLIFPDHANRNNLVQPPVLDQALSRLAPRRMHWTWEPASSARDLNGACEALPYGGGIGLSPGFVVEERRAAAQWYGTSAPCGSGMLFR